MLVEVSSYWGGAEHGWPRLRREVSRSPPLCCGRSTARLLATGSRVGRRLPGSFAVARMDRGTAPVTANFVPPATWRGGGLHGPARKQVSSMATPGGRPCPACAWCGPLWPIVQFETSTPSSTGANGRLGPAADAVLMLTMPRFLQLATSLISVVLQGSTAESATTTTSHGVRAERRLGGLDRFFPGGRREHGDSRCVTTPSGCCVILLPTKSPFERDGAIRPQAFAQVLCGPLPAGALATGIGQLRPPCGPELSHTGKALEKDGWHSVRAGKPGGQAQSPFCLRRLSGDPQRGRGGRFDPARRSKRQPQGFA